MANLSPPKQENNNNKEMKNSKSIKLNIGGMGIGGIVLLGGGLVAATLVSTLAIKRRRTSSKNTIDAPNQDFGVQNSRLCCSDEATGMKLKEMQPKPNRILTPDENQDSGVDSGDDGIVGEDQGSSLIYTDSVSEVENGYEKKIIMLDCDQQLDVASQTESGFPSITASSDIGGGGGGGGENDSEKSLDSIEAMEEYEAVEVEEIPSGHVVEDEGTVFMNEEAAALEKKEKDGHDEMIPENCEGDLIDETGYPDSVVNEPEMMEEAKIEVEDSLQVQILKEEKEIDGHDEITVEGCEGDSSYKTGEIMKGEKQQTENNNSEQVKGEEEAIKAACVETINMEEMQLNQVRETISNEEHPSFAVDGTTVTEGKEEKGKETAQEDEQEKDKEGEMPQVQLIEVEVEDEFVNEQESDKEGEMSRAQLIEVDDQPVVREDSPPRQLMTTEDELVEKEGKSNEDKIPLEEAKNSDEDVSEVSPNEKGYSSMPMQEEVIPEAKISDHKTEENMTIVGENQNDNDQNRIMKQDKSASNYKERFAKQATMMNQPWNLKLWTWSLLASIWCICHCYSELPFPELSLVGSLLFVFILFGYRKRNTKYSVKYE
ncbi:hypothetical protein OSB04_022892 [Centaurea solstitialis]|uniref:Uncharacterized protein n=1 Tax=Centaurea solstitialis TaxID=347529 RepID=A0AA38W8W5_9ASTR|nr:hypothetical protein OSB04_022892 [Centaurea solstitialis]